MPRPAWWLLLLPAALLGWLLYRVGGNLRRVIIACVLVAVVGATVAVWLMGVCCA